MIEEGLSQYLANDAGIVALGVTGVSPLRQEQGHELPAIEYERISGQHHSCLTGSSGLCHVRIQLNCWAASYKQASMIREAVRKAMHGFIGTMGVDGQYNVQSALPGNDRDESELSPGLDAASAYNAQCDYMIAFHEPRPVFV